MDDMQRKQLKGLRFIFLRNNEDLPEDAKLILRNMRGDFQDLGDAYMFKEALRSIYRQAKDSYHARIAFSPMVQTSGRDRNSGVENNGKDNSG